MITDGDCYEVHANHMIDVIRKDMKLTKDVMLCHGEVWHDKVGWHGHAWLELYDKLAYDISNGNKVCMLKEKYYEIGKIKNVKRYDYKHLIKKILETENYGSWD